MDLVNRRARRPSRGGDLDAPAPPRIHVLLWGGSPTHGVATSPCVACGRPLLAANGDGILRFDEYRGGHLVVDARGVFVTRPLADALTAARLRGVEVEPDPWPARLEADPALERVRQQLGPLAARSARALRTPPSFLRLRLDATAAASARCGWYAPEPCRWCGAFRPGTEAVVAHVGADARPVEIVASSWDGADVFRVGDELTVWTERAWTVLRAHGATSLRTRRARWG